MKSGAFMSAICFSSFRSERFSTAIHSGVFQPKGNAARPIRSSIPSRTVIAFLHNKSRPRHFDSSCPLRPARLTAPPFQIRGDCCNKGPLCTDIHGASWGQLKKGKFPYAKNQEREFWAFGFGRLSDLYKQKTGMQLYPGTLN